MVRFGNVLGSACSVLPIWTTQMQEGGPVTVTDPRMTRYFMTIPEAASLVIQAGAIDLSREPAAAVYVLDMGEPVRILDLARRFIRAHGFEPVVRDADTELAPTTTGLPAMEVRLSGARPGEKLHEELAYAAEQLRATPFPGINAWAGATSTPASIAALLADMNAARASSDHALVVSLIRKHVPEMIAPESSTRAA
jgi:FlaA1/EpsC-like NDP-sugar epimerase